MTSNIHGNHKIFQHEKGHNKMASIEVYTPKWREFYKFGATTEKTPVLLVSLVTNVKASTLLIKEDELDYTESVPSNMLALSCIGF